MACQHQRRVHCCLGAAFRTLTLPFCQNWSPEPLPRRHPDHSGLATRHRTRSWRQRQLFKALKLKKNQPDRLRWTNFLGGWADRPYLTRRCGRHGDGGHRLAAIAARSISGSWTRRRASARLLFCEPALHLRPGELRPRQWLRTWLHQHADSPWEVPVSTRRSTTTVETKVSVKAALERAPAGTLSAEQERVLRMRTGSSPDSRAPLGLVGQGNPETRAKLAMLEQMAIEAMRRPASAPTAEAPNSVKAHLLRRLRETPDRSR